MKSRSSLKKVGLIVLTTLTFGAGTAFADNTACPLESGAQASMPRVGAPGARTNGAFVYTQELHDRMTQIEQALRDGRITPYEAGRLMRQQWELAQFQQGFLASAQPARSGGGGCGLNPDLAAKLAPLGDMAISGMQSAGSLMRTLMRETERLIQDQTPPDKAPL